MSRSAILLNLNVWVMMMHSGRLRIPFKSKHDHVIAKASYKSNELKLLSVGIYGILIQGIFEATFDLVHMLWANMQAVPIPDIYNDLILKLLKNSLYCDRCVMSQELAE